MAETAVMKHLQAMAGLELPSLDESFEWTRQTDLATKPVDFYRPLAINHASLLFEYSVLCTQLIHHHASPSFNETLFLEQVMTALMMAELLTELYHHYLVVPREVVRFQREQLIYRQLLAKRIKFAPFQAYCPENEIASQWIRNLAGQTNWYRLFTVRAVRVLNLCVPLVKAGSPFLSFMAILNKYAGPVLAHLSWVFFVPRLSTNLFILAKHMIPAKEWMSEKEYNLGWEARLLIQLQRRWFEIANDLAWMIGGVLNCFVWLGPLAPVAMWLNLALFVYDVVLASIRYSIETNRIKALQADYDQILTDMQADPNASPERIDEIKAYIAELDTRMAFEKKRLLVSVVQTTGLAIAVIICLPMFAFTPVIPLIGAALSLTVTIVGFALTQYMETQRPPSNPEVLRPVISEPAEADAIPHEIPIEKQPNLSSIWSTPRLAFFPLISCSSQQKLAEPEQVPPATLSPIPA